MLRGTRAIVQAKSGCTSHNVSTERGHSCKNYVSLHFAEVAHAVLQHQVSATFCTYEATVGALHLQQAASIAAVRHIR